MVKLDAVLFENKVMEDVFLVTLLDRYLLWVPGTGINVLLLSCEVFWVFILVYYILAACMLIWYLRSLPKSTSVLLCKNFHYFLKGYYGSVYYIN